jgi:hypothetical protein
LLTKFQLDYILDFPEPQDALDAFEDLTVNMHDVYRQVFNRIGKSKAKTTVIKVVSWLFHARRPLHIDELREAISIRIRQTKPAKLFLHQELLVQYCQGLVTVDEESSIVRFTHSTVREYLQRLYETDNTALWSEVDIARACLTYLTLDVFEEGPCPDKESHFRRSQVRVFYNYVAQFWGSYTRGKGEEDSEVRNTVLRLFKSSQKRAALRQQQLLIQVPWNPSDIFQFSAFQLSTWLPIHIVAHEGLSTLYTLLEAGADVDAVETCYGPTALIVAAQNGHDEVVQRLLEAGATNTEPEVKIND